MDETSPPPRSSYDRLTAVEVENPPIATSTTGDPPIVYEFREFCYDFWHQMETAYQVIDWDRVFMTAFATVAIILVVFAFTPYLQSQMIPDRQLQHGFTVSSLIVSEFQAGPDQVTGKCEVSFNISNHGDRSVYHEISVLSVFLDHELIWVERMADFFIDDDSSITFNVSINKTTVSVPASFFPTVFKESHKLHKPLRFKLKYDGMLREGLAAWYEERSHIYVVCGWVEMWFINGTTLTGGPAKCSMGN